MALPAQGHLLIIRAYSLLSSIFYHLGHPLDILPWYLLSVSVLSNAVLAYFVFRPRKKSKKYDLSAQDLLHDLTRHGAGILRIEVIDPANLMLRSPRS